MSKKDKRYICSECEYETPIFYGKCPNCGAWSSLEEKAEVNSSNKTVKKTNAKKLTDVITSTNDRIVTNINEFNRVMGGGIVKDSISILTAVPGAGKSTLLLQVADDIAKKEMNVLYASGEESASQIKKRAERILSGISENIWILSTNSLDDVLYNIDDTNPDFIIIDSIQTFTLSEFPNSRAGTPTQTMECANKMMEVAKYGNKKRAVILIGQMTKEDIIAGVRSLEHLVDTVLIIEGESGEELRLLSATKNRYGSTGEMGFFKMTEKGMESIDNPSEFFVTEREGEKPVEGSAITVVREGTRPIILEVESLVSRSFTPYPSRVSECMGRDQLGTIISIIEQRAFTSLYDKNVVIKTTGGIKLQEQASNLAVIMSIISSVKSKPISSKVAFVADVGLTGELKKVPGLESRIKELDRIGFKKVYVKKGSSKGLKTKNIEIIEKEKILDCINDLF